MDPKATLNFGGFEIQNTDPATARVFIQPFCYERAPSYGTGSINGPLLILDASMQLERLDEETLQDWGDLAIHTAEPFYPSGKPRHAVVQMRNRVAGALERKQFLLSLGGDHAVTIGPVMAAQAVYPEMGVLQIDAHLDLRETWNGSRYNHACVMRRIMDDMHLPVVQVGIRAAAPEEVEYLKRHQLEPVYAHTIDSTHDDWVRQVVDRLPDKVYLTVDLDGLDPAVMPGTGTPEPGGLTYRQLVDLIRAVGKNRTVVAADITELAAIEGSHVSEYTAAKIASKIMIHCS